MHVVPHNQTLITRKYITPEFIIILVSIYLNFQQPGLLK